MGRPKRDYCGRGHNIAVSGRYPSGACRQCRQDRRVRPPGAERYCINGHDTAVVGRYKSGTCRECQRLAGEKRRLIKAGGKVASRRLLSYIKAEGIQDPAGRFARRYGLRSTSGNMAYLRLRRESRITIDFADRWCIALGTHLPLRYPELYYGHAVQFADAEELESA